MSKKFTMKRFMLAVLTLCLFTASAFAQGNTGRLVGNVAGPDGNIPGANVTIKDNQTGKEQTIQASGDGSFAISQLDVGTYTVTITAPGFKTFSSTDLKIDAARDYTLNATLEVGNISETVEVVAGADVVNSSNGELSTSVTPRQVKELPLNGRNPLNLLNLIAGSNATSSSINGQRSSSVNYTRDGVNVQDNFIRNGFVSDQPTVDDTGEFTVITQNAGAEYGSGSTQVLLVTPRGGSEFHGNAYEFNRNSRFAANNFFNNTNGVPRSALKRNQFGGTVNGPAPLPNLRENGGGFIHHKAFFYANYEAFRLTNQDPRTSTLLLPAARTGSFTYIDNAGVQRTVNVLNGTGFATALTAAQGGVLAVDPLIQSRILDPMPTGGNGAFTGINLLQAITINRNNPEVRNSFVGRFDVEPTSKHSFSFIYKYNKTQDARTDIAAGFSNDVFNTQGGPTWLYNFAYTMTPTASLSNEVRAAWQRSEPFFLSTTDPRSLPFLIGIPLATNPEASFQSQGRNTSYYNLQDNASYAWGNHSFRFGGLMQLYRIQSINNAGSTPTFSITTTGNTATPPLVTGNFPGGINSTDLGRANSLRYLLGGVVGSGSQTLYATSGTSGFVKDATQIRNLNYNNYAAYVSDQWRVSPRLTINFGLRYEFYTPLNNPDQVSLEVVLPSGADPIATILNPIGTFRPVGGNAGHAGDFTSADKNNFGPNISIAYSPSFKNRFLGSLFPGEGKTVIRGGYRVDYVNDEYVRSQDNAILNNAGLGSFGASARLGGTATGSTQFRVIGVGNAPIQAPIFVPISSFGPGGSGTRTFLESNVAAGGGNGALGGTISLIDPNFQVQRNYEYNFGIQREVGFQSVVEVRYVGGYSKELTRSIDYGQLDIRNNGFLPDFLKAQNNCRLQGATIAGTGDPILRCTDARFNPAIAGSVPLTVFDKLSGGGFLNNSVILGPLRAGTPGALAETFVINGINEINFLPNSNAGVVNFTTNGGRFNYNSLQVEFRRRFTGGLSLQANYTFQKILTDVTGSTDEVNQTRVEPYLDNNDKSRDYGRAIYDRTHTFNFNGQYDLPFGKGKRFLNGSGVMDRIFGGFQVSSIVNISSGVPTGIIDGRGTVNRAGRSATQPATSSLTAKEIQKLFGVYKTPNGIFIINPSVLFATATATGLPTLSGFDLTKPLPAGYTITSVRGANPIYTAPFPGQVFFPNAAGSTGNLSRNAFNGPMYLNWDAGLHKNIRITETTHLQLRGEMFNVLNNANFFAGSNPAILDVGSTSFGRLTSSGSVYSPRIVQFGVRFEF
jgi:hypothetical protein